MGFTNPSFETADPSEVPGLPDDWSIADSAQVEEIAAYTPAPVRGREEFLNGWTRAALGAYLYAIEAIGLTETAPFDTQDHEDFDSRWGLADAVLGVGDIGNELFATELGSNEAYDFSQKAGAAPGWGATLTVEKYYEDFQELFDNAPFNPGFVTLTEDQASTGAAGQVMYLGQNLAIESSIVVSDAIRDFVVGRSLADGITARIITDYGGTGQSYLLFGDGFIGGPIPSGQIEISYISGGLYNPDVDMTGGLLTGQGDTFSSGWKSNEDSLTAFTAPDLDTTTDESFDGILFTSGTDMYLGELTPSGSTGESSVVELTGTFAGEIQVQMFDGAWSDLGSPLTVPGDIDVPDGVTEVRLEIAAIGAGYFQAYVRWGRMATI